MTDFYELLSDYQRLNQLLRERSIIFDPQPGNRFAYRGQLYAAVAVEDGCLALVDDLCGIPIAQDRVLCVDQWETEPDCFFMPNVEQLIEIIFDQTTIYPSMTPGIRTGQDVWRVSHTNATPVIAATLEEALLKLTMDILLKE